MVHFGLQSRLVYNSCDEDVEDLVSFQKYFPTGFGLFFHLFVRSYNICFLVIEQGAFS